MIENRFRTFVIPEEIVRLYPEVVFDFFQVEKMLSVRADYRFEQSAINYLTYSPLFKKQDDGVPAPTFLLDYIQGILADKDGGVHLAKIIFKEVVKK